MKLKKYLLLFLLAVLPVSVYCQTKDRLTHKLVAGFNLGAASPLPIPSEVRSIDAFWPHFSPQLGYNISYKYNANWGISGSILVDLKGMGVRSTVKYMHTNVVLNEEGQTLDGYFSGRNETIMQATYLSLPVCLLYEPNQKWQFRIGGYLAYNYNSKFKGSVWDGYLRLNNFEDKLVIKDKGEATFDFGNEISTFDIGLTLGAERRLNSRFGLYSSFSWGLKPVFPSDFQALDYKMYNVYLTLGMTYYLR